MASSAAGLPPGLTQRTFALWSVRDEEGVEGMGEASPLPGYSPDEAAEAQVDLRSLDDSPLEVDLALSAHQLLERLHETIPLESPSARFAVESAALDWLGKVRGEPVHRLLGASEPRSIPIARLVLASAPDAWPAEVDAHVAAGVRHLKFKVGGELDAQLRALTEIRSRHPELAIRLDANRGMSLADLRRHATKLLRLRLELLEEPVRLADWDDALMFELPFALDETLRDAAKTRSLLPNPDVVAVIIKPTVVGGVRQALELGALAAAHGVRPVLSHTFDGPIARAASAEIALALGTTLAAGLGAHPALDLWPPHRSAAFSENEIVSHGRPGLGLELGEGFDA